MGELGVWEKGDRRSPRPEGWSGGHDGTAWQSEAALKPRVKARLGGWSLRSGCTANRVQVLRKWVVGSAHTRKETRMPLLEQSHSHFNVSPRTQDRKRGEKNPKERVIFAALGLGTRMGESRCSREVEHLCRAKPFQLIHVSK